MAAQFNDIIEAIQGAVEDFNSSIPASQKAVLADIMEQVKELDVSNGRIKTSVKNLKIVAGIKSRLQDLILNDQYLKSVQKFVDAYTVVSALSNEYFTALETSFKPSSILKEIKNSAIADTVTSLTEQGVASTIAEAITGILKTNITAGGTYKQLAEQLQTALTDEDGNPGLLTKNAKQVTTDAINQYSAQYTQAISAGLDFEWYAYTGSDIKTTRPFCDAMTDFTYFHVTEIPRLLAAEDLYYLNKKTGHRELVPIYDKTGLPGGMIEGTDPNNFFIRRGGYNCGHQIRPTFESLVPKTIVSRVKSTPEYEAYANLRK